MHAYFFFPSMVCLVLLANDFELDFSLLGAKTPGMLELVSGPQGPRS